MRLGGERQLQEPRGMGLLRLVKLPAAGQLLGGELSDGLQHSEARIGSRIGLNWLLEANQTGIVECLETIEDWERRFAAEASHCFRRVERPAAGKHRQASEEGLLRWIEEIMAPGDGPSQRLLALREVPATS